MMSFGESSFPTETHSKRPKAGARETGKKWKLNKTTDAKSWWSVSEPRYLVRMSSVPVHTVFVCRTFRSRFSARRTKNANNLYSVQLKHLSALVVFFLLLHIPLRGRCRIRRRRVCARRSLQWDVERSRYWKRCTESARAVRTFIQRTYFPSCAGDESRCDEIRESQVR